MYVHASMTALKWKTGNGIYLSMFVDNKVLNPQRALCMRVSMCRACDLPEQNGPQINWTRL